MTENQAERRFGLTVMLKAESDAVLRSPVFSRSPVLSKLLRFLVDQTASGNGDTLKSYAVAVDGLGRPGTFDPASDSSARVQMVRLRYALENYYAHHGPIEAQCLYLQPGSYRVRLGKLAAAYPLLYRPLLDADGPVVPNLPSPGNGSAVNAQVRNLQPLASESLISRSRLKRRHRFLAFGVAAGIIFALLAWFGWQQFGQPRSAPLSPILEVMPTENAGTPELAEMSRIISSTLANDLPRFKLARIRIVGADDVPGPSDSNEEIYQLVSRLEQDIRGKQRLYLRLNDARTDIAFWTSEIRLDSGAKTVHDSLVPIVAAINGPFGAIMAHGSILYGDNDDAGYACLLKYAAFVQSRQLESEPRISACLAKSVNEPRLDASILAVRALFSIERSSAMENFDSALSGAIPFARAAVASDPNDALANFAMARLSYLGNDCVSALFYTDRAVEANSNSPLILANLAALSPMCRYPKAADLLDRAFLAQSAMYPRGRLLLVLAALEQGRWDKIAEIKPSDIPQSEFSKMNYYLAETLIAGSRGQTELTARNWKRFVAIQPLKSRDPQILLGQVIVMPALRRKLVKILRGAGAFTT